VRSLRRCVAALLLGLVVLPWYGLVSARGSGPAAEQTLRLGPLYYANLWFGVALTAGAALLLSRLFRPGSLGGSWKRLERAFLAPPPAVYALALATLALGVSVWVSAGVLERRPALLDGVAQLVQARYLAGGTLSGPPLEDAAFWQFQFMVPTERGWVSQYPPGFAAVLALGVRAGAVWLVGPLLLAAGVFFTALAAERLFAADPVTARLGAALAATSPVLSFHAAAYMSHALALLLAAVALHASLRASGGSWRWSVLAGAALGGSFATRPYTAAIFGGVAALFWLVAPVPPRTPRAPWAPALAGALAGAAPFVAAVLLYNRRFFGSALLFGYEAAEGPGHRLGFGVDPCGDPYGLAEAIGYTSADLQGLGVEMLQGPLPAVLVVALYLLLAPRIPAGARLAAAWATLPVAGHALYWHHDLFMGPRLLYESIPGWCLLLPAGVVAAVRALPPGGRRFLRVGYVTREGVAAAFALVLAVGLLYAAPRKLASYGEEGARSGMTLAAPRVRGPALVFVHGSWEDRIAARLDAGGMRLDSVRAALENNPTCRLELYLSAREAPTPPEPGTAPERGPGTPGASRSAPAFAPVAGPPLRELRMPSGSVIRAYEGEALDALCERQAASDFAGVAALPPLLWQGDLPGLGSGGAMFVRDLGPEHNDRLTQRFPEREPLVLLRREGALRLLPYEEGMAALWSGPAASPAAAP
jgi:hypothetical protein